MPQMTLEPRACPICGTHDGGTEFAKANVNLDQLDPFAFASRKLPEYMHFRLMECQNCDLIYSDPAPQPADLAQLYRDAAFDSGVEAHYASRTYGRFLPAIVRRLPDRATALDIGTGDGGFLQELLDAGFTRVAGIEPSTAPIQAAAPAIRPLIIQDIFRPDSFEPESLSLITCFQTIEHLADPLSFCRNAWQTLKPGGALFLIGHNRRALSAKVLGFKSPIFDIEHMQLFSPSSLRQLLQTAGFQTVDLQTVLNRYPARYWARLFPAPRMLKPRLISMLQTSGLGRCVIPLPAGNLAAIAYKAPLLTPSR